VVGCRRIYRESISIRQELIIFKVAEKEKEYQQSYLEYISRVPTNQIPQKLFDYHPKEKRVQGWPPKK
jgi:hypothetical protein